MAYINGNYAAMSADINTGEGKSAYQIAVDNGFEGTEKEWLESLKGEQGEQGEQGEKGADGTSADDTNIINKILEFSQTAMPDTFAWSYGKINATGADEENASWYKTNYMKLDNVFKYYLFVKNSTNSDQVIRYCLYDENKNIIGGLINVSVPANTQINISMAIGEAKYVRLNMLFTFYANALVRFHCEEQSVFSTKKDFKNKVLAVSRNMSLLDYFGANKKVVLLGDSITQGLGSSDLKAYDEIDSAGNIQKIKGNGKNYGVAHNIPTYEIGQYLYTQGNSSWYEALDGNGYAHHLKNFLQNKFGCTVKNYGMSGITTGTLISQNLNSTNSGLVIEEDGTLRVFEGLTKGFDTVFIAIGTNDRGYENVNAFIYNLNLIVNYLINTDSKKVILMSMSPCLNDDSMNIPMSAIDEAIRGIATDYNIPFISVYNGVLDYCENTGINVSDLLNYDGVHPNDEGYKVIFSIICEALGINEVDKNYIDNSLKDYYTKEEVDALIKNAINSLNG